MPTISDQLTNQFYAWEKRGRGWAIFDEPIDLEPDFVPFFYHMPKTEAVIDDGKRHTLLSGFKESLKNAFASKTAPQAEQEEEGIGAYPYESDRPLCTVSVVFPKGHKIPAHETEEFILMLASCKAPVSFEIVATDKKITVQYVCDQSDLAQLSGQLKTYFPQAVLIEKEDALLDLYSGVMEVVDFGLSEEFMRPLAMAGSFDPDPFLSLFGFMEHYAAGEAGALQILFRGCNNPWTESILRSVVTNEGDAFFADAPDMLPLTKQKVLAPLFGVIVRAIGRAGDIKDAQDIALRIGSSLVHLSKGAGNRLIPLKNDDYSFETRLEDVLWRQTHRLGMLLNSRELATLVHFPSASVTASKLERDAKKTKAAPAIAQGHRLILGKNIHQGKEMTVSQSVELRSRHSHIIGSTGSGKSTLLLSMIVQDIEQRNGFAVIDPHGDLIDRVLNFLPANRAKDVLLIDPADAEYPVGFNILTAHSELEKDILSSDLVATFRRYSTSWGDQMGSVMANAIMAFLESSKGGTLADLRRFLIEKEYRNSFLKTVEDPTVLYYWHKEYPLLKTSSIGSILTRLDSFLRPKLIRNMVSQKRGIDFGTLMNEKKIILVKLSQGLIGEENSHLLGTFIVSKFQQAAMGRQAMSEKDRTDFYLYIDEFHHFTTPSLSSILDGTRKYKLSLVASHQDLNQLRDSDVANSVLTNAGTRICFRLGDADAKKLENGFSFFDAKDLQNLATGEAIARMEKSDFDFTLSTIPVAPSIIPAEVKDNIIAYSRQHYGTPRAEVEKMLAESMQMPVEEPVKEKRPQQRKDEVPPQKPIPPAFEPPEAASPEPVSPTPKPVAPVGHVASTAEHDTEKFVEEQEERQHTALKNRIKLMAEARGFAVTLEASVNEGKGFVDVSLERNGKRIACEVSITTSAEWELHNIAKCLVAGYEIIIACSPHKNTLQKIQQAMRQQLTEEQRAKVLTLEPDAFFQYLDELVLKEATTEERVRGRIVRREFTPLSGDSAKYINQEVNKIVSDAKRKPKKK